MLTRIDLLWWLVAASIPACVVATECTFPDGSNKCDAGPVLAAELQGRYCNTSGLCLEVLQEDTHTTYVIDSPTCREAGTLTGGIEFWPRSGDCGLAGEPFPSVYSASCDWLTGGIALFFDGGRVERLAFYD
jgi:hypothetical protein